MTAEPGIRESFETPLRFDTEPEVADLSTNFLQLF